MAVFEQVVSVHPEGGEVVVAGRSIAVAVEEVAGAIGELIGAHDQTVEVVFEFRRNGRARVAVMVASE